MATFVRDMHHIWHLYLYVTRDSFYFFPFLKLLLFLLICETSLREVLQKRIFFFYTFFCEMQNIVSEISRVSGSPIRASLSQHIDMGLWHIHANHNKTLLRSNLPSWCSAYCILWWKKETVLVSIYTIHIRFEF